MAKGKNDWGRRSAAATVLRFLTMIGLVLLSFESEEEVESLKEAILSLPFEEQTREELLSWLSADR